MAKSRLAASRNQNKSPAPPITKKNVTSLDLIVDIRPEGVLNSTRHNFIYWCHDDCRRCFIYLWHNGFPRNVVVPRLSPLLYLLVE